MSSPSITSPEERAAREIVISRIVDAPRDLVFQVWTDSTHLPKWWGPQGFTNTVSEIDVRPGGIWRFVMRGPGGVDFPNRIAYHEVTRPERMLYSHGSDEEPEQFQVTVTFAEKGEKTEVTMRLLFPTVADRQKMEEFGAMEGGNSSMDCLEEYISSLADPALREFVTSRVFEAPRELVFSAWTEAERLAQWWGPAGFTVLSAKVDLQPDGLFHYGMRAPNGTEMWGKFVYRGIVTPERLEFVVSFSDAQAGIVRHPLAPDWPLETLSTVTFQEQESGTLLTLRGIPVNATESERAAFEAGRPGMQQGWAGTLDQLAEYLANAQGAKA